MLIESAGRGVDAALFSAIPGTSDAPAGLLAGIAAMTPSSSTSPWDAMIADLAAIGDAVARAAGRQLAYILAPEQMIALKLRTADSDYPVLASAALPSKTIVCVASNAIASAFGDVPDVEVGFESALQLADPSSEIVTSAGTVASPGVVASVYQTDMLGLRLRLWVSWALRASNALAWMSNVAW